MDIYEKVNQLIGCQEERKEGVTMVFHPITPSTFLFLGGRRTRNTVTKITKEVR